MNNIEAQIRERLGIPSTAQYVLVMDQAAHMDWDWWSTFRGYLTIGIPDGDPSHPPVIELLNDAVTLLGKNPVNPPTGTQMYYYSICEMGFFQGFVQSQIEAGVDIISQIKAAANYLRIVGGGITSPDCLLTSGEGFLRNYLVGKLWLAKTFPELLPLKHCWLPDDFGQDPELPVAVKALGMKSISFSRLSGIPPNGNTVQNTTIAQDMITNGVDFDWICSDKESKVFTHWMAGGVPGYYQDAGLNTDGNTKGNILPGITSFLGYYNNPLQNVVNPPTANPYPPYTGAPTNYLYIPLDEDFMTPISDLLQSVGIWNANENLGVYAVEASYDDFVALTRASGFKVRELAYNGTPYYTGHYMSRPELKVLHYGATRLLLAAEVFGLLAQGYVASDQSGMLLDPQYWNRVAQAWNDFAPSTHHDYICGTAPDDVTQLEQVSLLRTTYAEAADAADRALEALAGSVIAPSGQVVIANPLGTAYTGPIELPATAPSGKTSITIGGVTSTIQATADGGTVFLGELESTGYTTGSFSTQAATNSSTVSISPTTSGASSYTLQNEYMTVIISQANNWGIESISADGEWIIAPNSTGNDLIFYSDKGNLYQFGNEMSAQAGNNFAVATATYTTTGTVLGATVLESGPVRVRLRTVVSISVASATTPPSNYIREYCLVAGEPFLRMTTTGAAPTGNGYSTGFSVMTGFTFAPSVNSIMYGTPCHWTTVQPNDFYSAPIFRATHNFVLPVSTNMLTAAIYHKDVPAWGYDSNGVLLGCLLRNTPASDGRGASGTDTGTHTLQYAIRVPNGLGDPSTGQPLMEALNYSAPVGARMVPAQAPNQTQTLTPPGFIASVSSPGVILAAKPSDVTPGTLILRLYQPTNQPTSLTVTLGRTPTAVIHVTALEDPILDLSAIKISGNTFTVDARTALTTVEVTF